MVHLTLPPAPELRPYVERYVVVERHLPPGQFVPVQVAPTSTSQLAINCATANLKPDDRGVLDRHYAAALVGPFTRRHAYQLHGHVHSVVTYFTPIGLHALLGLDLTRFADETLDWASQQPDDARQLIEAVRQAPGHAAKVAQVNEYFLSRLPHATPVDPVISHLTTTIRAQGGRSVLPGLLREVPHSQRTLERLFRRTTGLTLKQFVRITRFLTVRNAIADGRFTNWHDVLHAGGYYDQAHFIKEFARFTGQTPSAYFARDLGFDNFLLRPPV
jgi:AraC-like DNA-binding protein